MFTTGQSLRWFGKFVTFVAYSGQLAMVCINYQYRYVQLNELRAES